MSTEVLLPIDLQDHCVALVATPGGIVDPPDHNRWDIEELEQVLGHGWRLLGRTDLGTGDVNEDTVASLVVQECTGDSSYSPYEGHA